MPTTTLPPTRLEATLTCPAAGLLLKFAWAGIEISDARLGVALIPNAEGRLGVRVVGFPALTGFDDAVSLLDPDARSDFAPEALSLDGCQLRCLAQTESAPMLRQGFTVDLAPNAAAFLVDWLPRLARVATLAEPVAQLCSALLAPKPTAHAAGVCAELVAALLLDRKSVDAALTVVAQDHWAGRDPAWQGAFADPGVRQLLDAIAQESQGGPVATAARLQQAEATP